MPELEQLTIDELVDDSVERVLALLGIDQAAPKSWDGLPSR